MRRKMHLTEADSKYFPAFHEGISASRGDNWLGPAAYKDCVSVCSVACGRNAPAAPLRELFGHSRVDCCSLQSRQARMHVSKLDGLSYGS